MCGEVGFEKCGGVEAVAVAGACATGSTGTLSGRGFGDPGYVEGLEAVCGIEAALWRDVGEFMEMSK